MTMRTRPPDWLFVLALAIGALVGVTAHAQDMTDPKAVAQTAEASGPLVYVALGIVGVVWLLRAGLARRFEFFAAGIGAAALSVGVSFSGILTAAIVGGVPITGNMLAGAALVSLAGSGAWSQGKATTEAVKGRKRRRGVVGQSLHAVPKPPPDAGSVEAVVAVAIAGGLAVLAIAGGLWLRGHG
jgi:hypothetical protein